MLHLDRVLTEDGSYTLFDPSRNVTYRSIHGANTESEHVFIQPALSVSGSELRVFELGLGAGLNFIRTVEAYSGALDYYAVDHRPIPPNMVHANGLAESLLVCVLQGKGPLRSAQEGRAKLTLEVCSCLDSTLMDPMDAIFHDPFGPLDDPESWTPEVFAWERKHLALDGLILTYSAAGHVRRAMRQAGLYVASRPGPGRKREVSAAARTASALEQLSDVTKIWAPF